MSTPINKALLLFDNGESEKAVKLLEDYVASRAKMTYKTINAYETLIDFKEQMGADYSSELLTLEKLGEDYISGHTVFRLGLHYEKAGNIEKTIDYFKLYTKRVNDPKQFAETLGFADKWLRVKKEYFSSETQNKIDLYSKCNYGENMEVLMENERIFVLCESFVEEVNSGGLESYFSSDYSRYCVETAELLEKNKSKTYSKALKNAIKLFPKDFDFGNPEQTEEYMDEHEKMLDKFEKIEDEIYDSDEDIESILERVKENI